ncbi:unnamed protein product, partial [Prorocentrum cordatum]
ECVGDEICSTRQDLVVAFDGSGRPNQEGVNIGRRFALSLTGRYWSTYYGESFDNATAAAALPRPSATESPSARRPPDTSAGQALQAADNMFANDQEDAQGAALAISDGKDTSTHRSTMQ